MASSGMVAWADSLVLAVVVAGIGVLAAGTVAACLAAAGAADAAAGWVDLAFAANDIVIKRISFT